jgi:hypothetical protein
MLSVSKSILACFLVFSIGLLALSYWFEFYLVVYLIFVSLIGCLFVETKPASESEVERLSRLDLVFRILTTLLVIALIGLAIRSEDRMIQAFCLIIFILYHPAYNRAFPKEIRSKWR